MKLSLAEKKFLIKILRESTININLTQFEFL